MTTIAEQSMISQTLLGAVMRVCQKILAEILSMQCIAVKFVPWLLTIDQKHQFVNMCLKLPENSNKGLAFISRIIMRDKSWIYGYDPETKQQLS
jgi:hypothetical protein